MGKLGKNAGVNGGTYPNDNRLAESGTAIPTQPGSVTADFMAAITPLDRPSTGVASQIDVEVIRGGNKGTSA